MIAASDHAGPWIAWTVLLVVSAGLSFLYSALEMGIYVMNKIRLELHAEAGYKPARFIRHLLRGRNNFLAVLLLGSNAVNYAATFAVSAMFILAGAGYPRAQWYTLAIATPALFIFCESVPKNVAGRLGERLVYRSVWLLAVSRWVFNFCGLAPLLQGWASLLTGLIGRRRRHFTPLGRASVAAIVAEGHASGVLTHFQSIMADRVMHIGQMTLGDVMIPMKRVAAAAVNVDRRQLIEIIQSHNYSRLPLLEESGQVAGVLDIYDVLAAADDQPPQSKMSPPLVLQRSVRIPDALYRMQTSHVVLAVVADEDGRHVGIVTIKDLVKEIVGEMEAR